ncbi:MAG TPA: SRPBCC family protein [Jiangellaceae bacterium]|nr:SRPBCC family protein [Jiangellaceae bacterium]
MIAFVWAKVLASLKAYVETGTGSPLHRLSNRRSPGRYDQMALDVTTDIVIDRPITVVAGYAGDPTNAPDWYANIKSIEWRTPPPLGLGSKLDFVAQFLGRRLVYTYEVVELRPGRRLVMRTTQGPFPMETTYTWEPADRSRTKMSLRNRGTPSGFARITEPVMAAAVRRANQKDLARLKNLLESAPNQG